MDPPIQLTNVQAIVEAKIEEDVDAIFDSKPRTAMTFTKGGNRDSQGVSWFNRFLLTSKAVQEIRAVLDAKQHRR